MSGFESEKGGNENASKKRRTKKSGEQVFDIPSTAENTPTKRKRGRPLGSGKKQQSAPNGSNAVTVTPSKGKNRVLFSTQLDPSNQPHEKGGVNVNGLAVHQSDDEDDGEEDLLVRKIRAERGGDSHSSADEQSEENGASTAATPSKKSSRKRRKEKSPTPQDLPPHEQYFWQNRPGRSKASNKPLTVPLLTHEQFHEHLASYRDPHAESYEELHQLHTRSFPQWCFELAQDFNICLYGYGSKRRLVTELAQYLYDCLPAAPKIFIINGYIQNLNLRHVFMTLATLAYDCKFEELPGSLGSQPRDVLNAVLARLTAHPPTKPIYVFVNSLDATPLRRPQVPALFAQLASHSSVHLLATCDTPNFPLLWDVALREQYSWLFHDTTTFQTFAGVEIPSVVDEVNELLGRSGRSIKGKGGAAFVLKSLPENARNLYRVLITEALGMPGESMALADGIEDMTARPELGGVERKALYQKAVEEFICSNEMGFGQLLNEFYDHDMLVDRIDVDGTQILGLPWRREECEEILEELDA